MGIVAAVNPNPAICLTSVSGNVFTTASFGPYSGLRWADGADEFSAFNTILGPNSPACGVGSDSTDMVVPPQSYHPGGVVVVMADASARFVSDTIDTGITSTAAPTALSATSPYGVWGAMGSRMGGESVAMP